MNVHLNGLRYIMVTVLKQNKLNRYKMHRTKADRCRLQIKRREERNGMLHTEVKYREQIMNTGQCEKN